ncbi:biopolymer transporter ExbD [Ramlibacter solisilvae]|uniref:Biopolymer transporter ExbD n=1 Tax=Ramlibacter tataouinensis TaxID=94132 RepID=A0A127JVT1_9BURK|nr:biopolymer transporter ExbD [Ramlibacter tataouinensis]AMO23989.1 biopolymer transporter ExbD [Ramlibacter tataouinensis]
MAMAVGPASDDDVISTINTTPLVDVMLVLLIIFLITIPVVTTSIPVTLPKERVEVRETKPENIIISVDTSGGIFWYDQKMPNTDALVAKLKTVSKMTPQPEVQIRGDLSSRYEGVGKILLACQRAGITKVAFITEPPPLGG